MKTGKLVKELRQKKGMTQEDLADKTEVSSRTIQRIENGEVEPRAYTLQMISKALEVDFSIFVENVLEENYEPEKFETNNWLAIIHLSGIIPLFIPTLVLWKIKKRKTKNMIVHFRAALSMQLCICAISLTGVWIYWKTNISIPLFGGLLVGGLIAIMNTILVMAGKSYVNPFIKN